MLILGRVSLGYLFSVPTGALLGASGTLGVHTEHKTALSLPLVLVGLWVCDWGLLHLLQGA